MGCGNERVGLFGMGKMVYSMWNGRWEWEYWRCCMGSVFEEVGLLGKGKGGIQRVVWEVGLGEIKLWLESGGGIAGVIVWEMGVNIVQ